MRAHLILGRAFGAAAFGAAILGWFWGAELVAVGAGWHLTIEAGQRVAQAVQR